MFVHSDRLPASPAVPRGFHARALGRQPHGGVPAMAPAYDHVVLDERKQTAAFSRPGRHRHGEMPGLGTSTGTAPATGTSGRQRLHPGLRHGQ
ncbi:hypothetical protein [Streptomyces sp. KL116D]|uniref:hypothetical protein n=1 Tax=Streptomyces sp. KL116D TaxID=3045152 RepID=UPI0035592FE9